MKQDEPPQGNEDTHHQHPQARPLWIEIPSLEHQVQYNQAPAAMLNGTEQARNPRHRMKRPWRGRDATAPFPVMLIHSKIDPANRQKHDKSCNVHLMEIEKY
jgi:hypothetical protein